MTSFGIACPATLNDENLYTTIARSKDVTAPLKLGEYAINKTAGKKHIFLKDYARYFSPITLYFDNDAAMSRNVMKFYNTLAINNDSVFDVSNINVSKLYLFNGYDSDFIVPFNDQPRILNSSNLDSQNEQGIPYTTNILSLEFVNHVSIKNNPKVKNDVKDRLKGD